MSFLDDRRFRAGFAIVVLFTALAGDAWRYSISWAGYAVVVVILTVFAVLIVRRDKSLRTLNRLPYPVLAFLALTLASIAWSFYPGASAVGTLATWMTVAVGISLALTFSWTQLVSYVSTALRIILATSLVFEAVVSLFVRGPVLPLAPAPGVDYSKLDSIPKLMYWSRDELFTGGKIQGIVGNSSLLGFLALLALLVFSIQLASRSVLRAPGILWILVAALTIYLTRSATITVALVVLAAITALVLLLRRTTGTSRRVVWAGAALIVAGSAAVVAAFPAQLLGALGKSPDLTHRLDIWAAVSSLATERPVVGWGWVSYWVPWVPPFDTLAFNSGVRQLHAHNAWLDVQLQLGAVGLVVFGALVLSTLVRSWNFAVDHPVFEPQPNRHGTAQVPGVPAPYSFVSLAPLLIVVALIVQSFAESRLLIEYGMLLLTMIAVRTKLEPSAVVAVPSARDAASTLSHIRAGR